MRRQAVVATLFRKSKGLFLIEKSLFWIFAFPMTLICNIWMDKEMRVTSTITPLLPEPIIRTYEISRLACQEESDSENMSF